MGLFGKLFGGKSDTQAFVGNEGMTLEDAKAAQEVLQSRIPSGAPGTESARVNAAAKLMTARQFDECIAAYESIANDFPHRRGDCESQVGAAQFFKGEFEKAIFSYLAAREHGADASMMDDNLWEACEAMAKAVREPERKREAYMRYKVHCPNGKYIKNLKKLYG